MFPGVSRRLGLDYFLPRLYIETMSTPKRPPRNQVNLVVDDEIREAIDEIRAMRRPVPTISEAIRQAILNERDSLKSKIAAQERRKQ